MNLIKPPLFVCNDKQVNEEQLKAIDTYIKTHTPELPKPLEKTNKEKEQINSLRQAVYDFGVSLGLDLSHKISSEDKFYFYDYKSFELIRKKYELESLSEGFCFISGQIVVIKNSNAVTLGASNHEQVHLLSNLVLGTNLKSENAQFYQKKYGYHSITPSGKEQYRFFNEGITEIINLEIMKQEWIKHNSLKDLIEPRSEEIAYEPVIEIVGRIINNMQKRVPSKNIKEMFMIGYLTGSTEPIDLINELYPKDKNKIANMHPYSYIPIF